MLGCVDKVTTVTPFCFFCRLAGMVADSDSDSSTSSAPRLPGIRQMKGRGMELSPSCPISTIYVIFLGSTSLRSRFPRFPETSIPGDETCGARSVIKPFKNQYTLILSLCPPLFWPTLEVRFDNIQVCCFPTSRERSPFPWI
jgi:hypothetical protein